MVVHCLDILKWWINAWPPCFWPCCFSWLLRLYCLCSRTLAHLSIVWLVFLWAWNSGKRYHYTNSSIGSICLSFRCECGVGFLLYDLDFAYFVQACLLECVEIWHKGRGHVCLRPHASIYVFRFCMSDVGLSYLILRWHSLSRPSETKSSTCRSSPVC